MGRAKKASKDVKATSRLTNISKWKIPNTLKDALKAHPQWPTIGAKIWQEVAMTILGLNNKLERGDRRYNMIH